MLNLKPIETGPRWGQWKDPSVEILMAFFIDFVVILSKGKENISLFLPFS